MGGIGGGKVDWWMDDPPLCLLNSYLSHVGEQVCYEWTPGLAPQDCYFAYLRMPSYVHL